MPSSQEGMNLCCASTAILNTAICLWFLSRKRKEKSKPIGVGYGRSWLDQWRRGPSQKFSWGERGKWGGLVSVQLQTRSDMVDTMLCKQAAGKQMPANCIIHAVYGHQEPPANQCVLDNYTAVCQICDPA